MSSHALPVIEPISARHLVTITFHDAQQRQRARTWRMTFVCLVAAVLAGAFLSVVMLLFAPVTLGVLAGLALRIIQALGLAEGAVEMGNALVNGPAAGRNAAIAAAAMIVVLPALLSPPLAWAWLRALMLRPQPTPWPSSLTVRAPRIADAEERQFANVVEEMALAAGLSPPAVGIVDDLAPNIAIFGTGHRDAGIVATRGLLDTLDRAETQMLVAQATGAIGNGDLSVSASLLAVYRAVGLFMTFVDLPFSRAARHAVAALVGATFGRDAPGRLDAAYAVLDGQVGGGGRLLGLLLWLPAMLIVPGVTFWLVADRFDVDARSPWGAMLPAALLFTGAAVLFHGLVRVTLGIWTILVLGWPLALVWRSRRFLADATAVGLAGDPQSLADALAHLRAACAIPAGGERLAHLFLCQPRGAVAVSPLAALEPSFDLRTARLRALGATDSTAPDAVAGAKVSRAQRTSTTRFGLTAVLLVFFIANIRLTGFLLAVGLGGLLVLSCGAGLLLFTTIVNA